MPSSRNRALVQSGPNQRKSGRMKRIQDQWIPLECLLPLSRGSPVLCPARFSNYCVFLLDTTPPSTGAGSAGRNRHLLL
jgi:hypothetical protein